MVHCNKPHPLEHACMSESDTADGALRFIREHVRGMQPYVPGEQVNNACKLNTNECPWPASPRVFETLRGISGDQLRQYPSPAADQLRAQAAAHYGCAAEQVLAGNGSDDCLTIIYRSICRPDAEVCCPWPSYGLYDTLAQIENVKIRHCDYQISSDRRQWQLDTKLAQNDASLCLIANPNNPSGTLIQRDELEALLDRFSGVVVVDEAYIDFADDSRGQSLIDAINRFDNLVVLRTFSKSYSLAGARVGLLFANAALVNQFNKVKDSYNVNVMSQLLAGAALADSDYHHAIVSKTLQSRRQLEQALSRYGWSWPESQANFLLCHVGNDAERIYLALKERGILVRWWQTDALRDYLRITAGKPEENQALFEALDDICT